MLSRMVIGMVMNAPPLQRNLVHLGQRRLKTTLTLTPEEEKLMLKAMQAAEQKALKRLISSSGPVSARRVFLSKIMTGSNLTMKEAMSAWTTVPPEERAVYEEMAAENRTKREAIRKTLKTPANEYATFTKQHFAVERLTAEQEGALEGLKGQEILTTVSKRVAAKYRLRRGY